MKILKICLLVMLGSASFEASRRVYHIRNKSVHARRLGVHVETIRTLKDKLTANLHHIKRLNHYLKKHKGNRKVELEKLLDQIDDVSDYFKTYIDNFILTKKVVQNYENHLEHLASENRNLSKEGEIDDILKFFIKNYRDRRLRKNEKDLFGIIKGLDRELDKDIDNVLFDDHSASYQNHVKDRMLECMRMMFFIKGYMRFIENLKEDFHFLDFDEKYKYPKEEVVEPVMKHKGFRLKKSMQLDLENKGRPITIMIGNEGGDDTE